MYQSSKKNLLLDLDNTLIFSLETNKIKKGTNSWLTKFKNYKMDDQFVVNERPHLQDFLKWAFDNFNVSIWSAGSREYVKFIVDKVVLKKYKDRKLRYIFDSETCEESEKIYNQPKKIDYLWKYLKLTEFNKSNTYIVDDLDEVIDGNEGNSIRIKKFIASKKTSDGQDRELIRIMYILKNLI
jgi:TFIIF-interacting CTD phosphatase-like protein